jgi:CPA2 family monovalent cation:H+ antiporter-2
VLRRVKIPYAVLDLNAETVRRASVREGEPIMYGDATRKEVLHRLNLEGARIIVLATSDPIATRRTVALAREMNPDIHIIVRTRYMAELPDLYKLGADQVIPEEFETSIEIFSRVLREYGIARNVIQGEVEEIRREGYQMLRDSSLPLLEMSAIGEALGTASTETLFIGRGSPAVGKTIGEMDLRKRTGATVITAIRAGKTEINPGPDYMLEAEDILVLLGGPEQIETAIEQINTAAAGGAANGPGPGAR